MIVVGEGGTADWQIEIERNGKWIETIYAGTAEGPDQAYIEAKRHLRG